MPAVRGQRHAPSYRVTAKPLPLPRQGTMAAAYLEQMRQARRARQKYDYGEERRCLDRAATIKSLMHPSKSPEQAARDRWR